MSIFQKEYPLDQSIVILSFIYFNSWEVNPWLPEKERIGKILSLLSNTTFNDDLSIDTNEMDINSLYFIKSLIVDLYDFRLGKAKKSVLTGKIDILLEEVQNNFTHEDSDDDNTE